MNIKPENESRKPTINFVGAGLVGKVFGRLMTTQLSAEIKGIVNTSLSSSEAAVRFIGQGSAFHSISELPAADIIFITTPDSCIQNVCEQIVEILKRGGIVVHCSGVLSAEILSSARKKGCAIARIHPIKHITSAQKAVETFAGTHCVFEGDKATYERMKVLFTSMGSQLIYMDYQKDYKYHTACVFATTYPQLIIAGASLLYEACGMHRGEAIHLARNLAVESLKSISKDKEYRDFVEGPIKRFDLETLQKNLKSIEREDLRKVFEALTYFSVNISHHPEEKKEVVYDLLHSA